MQKFSFLRTPGTALLVCASVGWMALGSSPALAQSQPQAHNLNDLQALIAAQQKQIELQTQQIQAQQKALEALKADVTNIQKAPPMAQAQPGDSREVTSGEPRIKLAISGQVNRAVNTADDGGETKSYFVDNQNSTSRFRFVGTGQVNPDFSIGSKIEIGVRPNSSNSVNQTTEDSGDSFDQRVVEAFFESKTYGKVSLGKGSMAADGAHEVDLSGTDVMNYASISDLAGGLFFRNPNGTLSTTTVGNAFTDYDGGREDRIRYDTPRFLGGFTLAAAGASDQRWDTGLYWTGESDSFKMGAGLGLQDPNVANVNSRYGGSASILHKPTGLNFTVSAAADDRSNSGGTSDPHNLYGKVGWIQNWFSIGKTAMSVDFTESSNVFISNTQRPDGESVGLGIVQSLNDYGVDFYGGYRWYSLDDFEDISVVTFGSRVKF
jgi:hypothetical protein